MSAPARTPAPRGYEPGECRDCKHPVFWATLVDVHGEVQRHPDRRAKRLPPIDREPLPGGTILLVEGGRGRGRFITPYEASIRRDQVDPDPLYQLHVCPPGTRKRRRRGGGSR